MLEKNIAVNNFINSLSIQNFRNHENIEIITKKPSVVIYGKNGVGKTSILEAISIFTNSKGLRNSKLIEMIKVNESPPQAALSTYSSPKLPPEISFIPKNGKTKTRNKIKYFFSFSDTKNEIPTMANKIKKAVFILHCSASG